MKTNLTETQKDYAVFLPSISGFYGTFVGKQRYEDYVDPSRVPAGLGNVESLNFLNPKDGAFHYKWALYSAGHADLDTTKFVDKEDMVRNRDRDNSWLLGDSGGFQIAKGLWPGDWTSETCPHANKKRELVVNWMEEYMDYGMMLDIPTWTFQSAKASKATNIKSYDDAVKATHINARYYMKHRRGNFKVLNVLQGSNHTNADSWYEEFKGYCDPKQYPDTHFNGWAMGGQNMCDVHLILRRLVHMIHDGLLEQGLHDVMHFLGTSKLEWALVLTAIQRGVRKNHNENFTITFDCASPFLCTANGQFYTGHRLDHNGKWSYMMGDAFDDRQLATNTTSYDDYATQHCAQYGHTWMPTPLSEGLKVNDICCYAPGDTNRMGTETKTSWDSFAYMLMMNHNTYTHINSVQAANRAYDAGDYPSMLVDNRFDRTEVKDVIARIFELDDKEKALKMIDDHEKLWMMVVGTRGAVGKKTVNTSAQFNSLFEAV